MIWRGSARVFCTSGSWPGHWFIKNGGMPPKPTRGGWGGPADLALPLAEDVDERLAVEGESHSMPQLRVIEGRLIAVDEQVAIDAAVRRQLADRVRPLAFHILQERYRHGVWEGHVQLAGNKRQCCCRHVADDRKFYAIEIRPILLPVIRVSRHLDSLVRLELLEFERTGADRMLAHVARRHVAGIDRREPVSEQHQERRLRPLQMEGDLVIAIRGDLFEVAIPGFERIDTELVARLFEQEVPGALDVLGRERFAVMPFDALA